MKSPIPDSDRIPLLEKVAFGIGNNADAIAISMMISTLWMPFFNIGMGMSPVVLGFVLMGLRAWDAVSDPLVGHFTDNARTRWGRRKPFMFFGILAAACIYPLFWFMPRELSDVMKVMYLSGVGVLFFTATTCWGMAYYAMMMEMTPNYDERTRIAFWMSVFGKINTLAGGWIMALVTSSFFADPATGQADIVNGMRHVGWGIAVVFVICGLLPVFFVRERFANSDLVKKPEKGTVLAEHPGIGEMPSNLAADRGFIFSHAGEQLDFHPLAIHEYLLCLRGRHRLRFGSRRVARDSSGGDFPAGRTVLGLAQ